MAAAPVAVQTASDRQRKAVERVLWGRHYSKAQLSRLELFLLNPMDNAKAWFKVDTVRVIRWVQINKPTPLLAVSTVIDAEGIQALEAIF